MILSQIISTIEKFAPLSLQESYDNSGLIIGTPSMEINSTLLCVDITEQVIEEAIEKNCNLIISHHPLVFAGIKKINGNNYVERCIIKAIKNDIAIYACHTNMDIVAGGVSYKMSEKLQLTKCRILSPTKGNLNKIVCFVPEDSSEKVRNAMFEAGAGSIGNYDNCSYNSSGYGSFRAGENTNPYVGEKGKTHLEKEIKIETIVQSHLSGSVINAIKNNHPYEEVAYDIYPLNNENPEIGFGIIGELKESVDCMEFLNTVKNTFRCQYIKHTPIIKNNIKKVALCGGSGSFLTNEALAQKADIFISADFKYHDYFKAENKLIIADIGHYESEQFTKEIFYDLLTKKIPNFAVRISEINTNPINYI